MTWVTESVREFAVGDWRFELRDDEISRIRYRGVDVLRGVRAVTRDSDWATPVWTVAGVEAGADGIRIELVTDRLGAGFDASVSVSVDGGALAVDLEATSRHDYLTNRTGLIVLHPPQLSGAALHIEHSDGSAESTAFPVDISPHQPALDIRSLAWSHNRVRISCAFDGDVFEMEDQRNWTDASYKTYSRPLALPFPYPIAAGETVRQSVRLTAEADPDAAVPDAKSGTASERSTSSGANGPAAQLTGSAASDGSRTAPGDAGGSAGAEALAFSDAGAMPAVSVGASTAPGVGPAPAPVGADLLVEVDLGWDGWPAVLKRAARSGLPLDVRLVLPETEDATALRDAARALADLDIARATAFRPSGHDAQHVSDTGAIALLRAALTEAGMTVPVIGGTRSHFTELNREHHRLPAGLDGVVFSLTPTFHAFETLQVEQSIAMQRLVAEQAVRIAGDAPVHVGPITLRAHVNNVATRTLPRPSVADLSNGYGPELLDADDPRQSAPELAAWVIASASALSVPGVTTLSFFEEWGPRGIRTASGDDLPVAEAIRALAVCAGAPLQTARSSDDRVWALRAGSTTLAASLSEVPRTVVIDGRAVALGPRAWRRL
ncbi:hypothetical protein [Microbacterium halotolerans]|uniref:hypothetical protein n=1 Tax=Microbacterium halotolerans TaxID=246613 RepID=UPI000E6AAD1D|nr:hypothetical protein [Microbacterium halotolerans]